jgi:hypothetical protein
MYTSIPITRKPIEQVGVRSLTKAEKKGLERKEEKEEMELKPPKISSSALLD